MLNSSHVATKGPTVTLTALGTLAAAVALSLGQHGWQRTPEPVRCSGKVMSWQIPQQSSYRSSTFSGVWIKLQYLLLRDAQVAISTIETDHLTSPQRREQQCHKWTELPFRE